jgi:hypothetical protein
MGEDAKSSRGLLRRRRYKEPRFESARIHSQKLYEIEHFKPEG